MKIRSNQTVNFGHHIYPVRDVYYKITDRTENILTEGKLTVYPDETGYMGYANILPRLKNYVKMTVPDLTAEDATHNHTEEAYRTLKVYTKDDSTSWTLEETYDMLFCWSDINIEENMSLSSPINGHMDSRMKLLYTVFRENGGQICYED